MEKYFLIFAIFVFLHISSVGFPAYAINNLHSLTNDDSLLIINLENNWTIALVNKDETVFRKYLGENFIYTENEKLFSRDEVLKTVMSASDTIENSYNEDMQVHIYENTAIVTGKLMVIGKGAEGNFHIKYRFTDVWFNLKGNWQLIAAQDYVIP